MTLFRFVALLALLASPGWHGGRATVVTFPAGTVIPVRFPQSLEGGREPVGTRIAVQTTAPLVEGECEAVPAFADITGAVIASRKGGLFGQGGVLDLRFDSLALGGGRWAPLSAVLDSLEWHSRGVPRGNGTVKRRNRSIGTLARSAGVVGLAGVIADLDLLPIAAITGFDLVRPGGRPHILTGEHGALRLEGPLMVPLPSGCLPRAAPVADSGAPAVPVLPPRAVDRSGKGGDPINLVLRGTLAELDSAFRSAGWSRARPSTFGALAQEVEAVALSQRDADAPMSHEFYLGRMEDLRYERASPSARARHHVRLWKVDSTGTLWAAAAIEDIGMLVSASHRTVTHRVAPDVDRERALLVDDLQAGRCTRLEGYVTLAGSVGAGATVAGQRFVTDRRVAVLSVAGCGGASGAPPAP